MNEKETVYIVHSLNMDTGTKKLYFLHFARNQLRIFLFLLSHIEFSSF